jgi:hypothetical protein
MSESGRAAVVDTKRARADFVGVAGCLTNEVNARQMYRMGLYNFKSQM